jgi:hypothetical protein
MESNNTESQEQIKKVTEALIKKRFYNPYDVFQHPPEYYACDDERYKYKIHLVKWNTRSTRMTVLYARYDDKKNQWVFATKAGLKRNPHGEKMR